MKSFRKMLLIAVVTAVSACFLGIGAPNTKAATVAEIQAMIANLRTQIAQLQKQLNAIQEKPAVWCHDFQATLKYGNNGTEVSALQTALEKEGFKINEEDGYFGAMTTSAVTGFQQKYKDEILKPLGLERGTGYVGANTRKKLNELYGCKATPPSETAPSITLVFPRNASTNVSQTPLFTWSNIPDASSYTLYYRKAGMNGFWYKSGLKKSQYQFTFFDKLLPSKIEPSTKYEWKVAVDRSNGRRSYSSLWSFTTAASSISQTTTPNLLSPRNASTNVSQTPLFTWSNIPDVSSYTLYYRKAGMNGFWYKSGLKKSQYQFTSSDQLLPSKIEPSTKYEWKVAVDRSNGRRSYSSLWSFTTASVNLSTCSELGGTICSSDETCSGSLLESSDNRCCNGECKSVNFSNGTIIYETTKTHNGNLSGRNGADLFCRSNMPVGLTCNNIHAFISVNGNDEIRKIPSNYLYNINIPIYWYHSLNHLFTNFAKNWDDMLDGSILVKPEDGLGKNFIANTWNGFLSGSKNNGTIDVDSSYNNACNGWTYSGKASSNNPYYSAQGDLESNSTWIHSSTNYAQCSEEEPLLCVCSIGASSCNVKHDHQSCYNGNAYWFNSCNNPQEMISDCSPVTCGEWGAPYCYQNRVYKKRHCSGNPCNGGACVTKDYWEYKLLDKCEESGICKNGSCVRCDCSGTGENSSPRITRTYDCKTGANGVAGMGACYTGTLNQYKNCGGCFWNNWETISGECSCDSKNGCYSKITPAGHVCAKPAYINIGSKNSSGYFNEVEACGLFNGQSFHGKATCLGSWSVNPCAWTSSCSTGWIWDSSDFYSGCSNTCVTATNINSLKNQLASISDVIANLINKIKKLVRR